MNPTDAIDAYLNQLSLGSRKIIELLEQMTRGGFFIKDRQARLITMNDAFVRKLGYNIKDSLLLKTNYDLESEDMAVRYIEDDRKVMDSGKNQIRKAELILNAEHKLEWMVTTKVPLYDKNNKVVGIVGYFENMSDATHVMGAYTGFEKVLSFMESHITENISIAQLAKLKHISVRQFERQFTKSFGVTPKMYWMRLKIQQSIHLLINSNQSLSEVAQQCGFYDQSHFSRTFKISLKISPLQFRRSKKINS